MTTKTTIAHVTTEDVFIRGQSLCRDLVGHLTFTEMIVFQVLGWRPTPAQTRLVDACLVTLMEHGMTPSALAARLVYGSASEALQGAVAAGLLAVGGRFAGTTEAAGALITRLVVIGAGGAAAGASAGDAVDAEADVIVAEHRAKKEPVPGFGHPQHKPDDPRSLRLLALAREEGVAGPHVAALSALARAVDRAAGKHVTINATGAIAAVLADVGVPASILRGFALIARAAGLVGHLLEEQRHPAMRAIWEAGDRAVPYEDAPSQ